MFLYLGRKVEDHAPARAKDTMVPQSDSYDCVKFKRIEMIKLADVNLQLTLHLLCLRAIQNIPTRGEG